MYRMNYVNVYHVAKWVAVRLRVLEVSGSHLVP